MHHYCLPRTHTRLLLQLGMRVLSLPSSKICFTPAALPTYRHFHTIVHQQFSEAALLCKGCDRAQVEPGTIWCFEQEHALAGLNVATTIRMTVVKLKNGELLVYAPVAPTR